MAVTREAADALAPILERVARAIGNRKLREGDVQGAGAALRIVREENVRRTVQAYWTPFQANIPGDSVGLHLEVAEPRVHWAEAYVSPRARSWVFCFQQRADENIQLAYYRDHAGWQEAVDAFFNLAGWYVLTPTDAGWNDVVYRVDPELPWAGHHRSLAGTEQLEAIQGVLKKSSIVWVNWHDPATGQHTMPVWYVWDAKAERMYILSGERQQTLPGAARIRHCRLMFREKGKNTQIGEVEASVRVLEQGAQWDEAAEKIAEKRLNIPGLPEETAKRWRDECVILELTFD